MSAALSCTATPTPLPHLFGPVARRARFASLAPCEAIRLASEILVRALNAIAIDPASRVTDRRVTDDRRFSLALTVAVPLSLQGRPAQPERFRSVERRVVSMARERGVTGPAGRSLEAARLIACAVTSPAAEVADYVGRAVDAAIDAEVLAASLQGRDLTAARATAERRALDIFNPDPRTEGVRHGRVRLRQDRDRRRAAAV